MGESVKRLLIVIAAALIVSWSGLATGQSQDESSPPAGSPAPTQQDVPQRVSVSSGVMGGLLIKRVNPKYPEKARKKYIQGTVVLRATINTNGDIADLTLFSGDPMLAKAAIDAVRRWKYKPYFLKGHPVEVETQIQVNFALSN